MGAIWLLLSVLGCATKGGRAQYGTAAATSSSGILAEAPRIRCGESSVKVTLVSNQPFEGNVYAKGFFSRDSCKVAGDGSGNVVNITIPVTSDCGIRRRRTVNPKGIVLEMTIVLMFHQMLLTKNDKAFHIECMYMEMSQRITNRLEVSMLPERDANDEETSIRADAPVPYCRYEVLDDQRKKLAYATIGQSVYHRWFCESSGESSDQSEDRLRQYCLTVHSCEVDDGHGNVQKLLDINGCPVDKSLMGPVEYGSELEAEKKSSVFKFADKPTVFFSCQLRLHMKGDIESECLRTSDYCQRMSPHTNVDNSVKGYEQQFPTPKPTVTPSTEQTSRIHSRSPTYPPTTSTNAPSEGTTTEAQSDEVPPPRTAFIEVMPSSQVREFDQVSQKAQKSTSTPTSTTTGDSSSQVFVAQISSESFLSTHAKDQPASLEKYKDGGMRMFAGPSVELDVTAPAVDVVDVAEAAPDLAPPPKVLKSDVIDVNAYMKPNQVCVTRSTVSFTVLVAICMVLVLMILLGTLLGRAVQRQRALHHPHLRFQDGIGDHRVLSAYTA